MSKQSAIDVFMNSFGIKAFEETTVSKTQAYPFISYSYAANDFNEGEVSITVNIWYYSESHIAVNNKVEQLSQAITRGGVQIPCEQGTIWIKKGRPFVQSLGDPEDAKIRRRYIQLTAEFLTV